MTLWSLIATGLLVCFVASIVDITGPCDDSGDGAPAEVSIASVVRSGANRLSC